LELMHELAATMDFDLVIKTGSSERIASTTTERSASQTSDSSERSLSQTPSRPASKKHGSVLKVAVDRTMLQNCDHMLVYLNDLTWTRGSNGSVQLAADILQAMDENVHLLIAHEMIGVGQDKRSPCEFDSFFACSRGSTPQELLQRGIYDAIATPLKGREWRQASMVMLVNAIALHNVNEEGVLVELSPNAERSWVQRLRSMQSSARSSSGKFTSRLSRRFSSTERGCQVGSKAGAQNLGAGPQEVPPRDTPPKQVPQLPNAVTVAISDELGLESPSDADEVDKELQSQKVARAKSFERIAEREKRASRRKDPSSPDCNTPQDSTHSAFEPDAHVPGARQTGRQGSFDRLRARTNAALKRAKRANSSRRPRPHGSSDEQSADDCTAPAAADTSEVTHDDANAPASPSERV